MLNRVTEAKRMRAKLHKLKRELWRRMHLPIPEQGVWLGAVVRGHLNYYGVPGNSEGLLRTSAIRRPGTGIRAFGAAASAPRELEADAPPRETMALATQDRPSLA